MDYLYPRSAQADDEKLLTYAYELIKVNTGSMKIKVEN